MRSVRQVEQTVSWVMRKYVRFLVVGALTTCTILNLALHAGTGLQYYCRQECLTTLLKGPVTSLDRDAIFHIRDYWVDEPAPRGSYKADFSLDNPPWGSMNNWKDAYKFINDYFKTYKDRLWLRYTPDNLPPLLHRVQEGSNRLIQYVAVEDRELGQTVMVQCFNAGALTLGALRTAFVDLLVISTHGGELNVFSSIPITIHYRMVVLVVPLATQEEVDELQSLAKRRGLIPVFHRHSIHILLPQNEVKFV
nr:uncharacterized protein LOC128684123 [Cherax quadricarinatus]